jgi:hypothetical protein
MPVRQFSLGWFDDEKISTVATLRGAQPVQSVVQDIRYEPPTVVERSALAFLLYSSRLAERP